MLLSRYSILHCDLPFLSMWLHGFFVFFFTIFNHQSVSNIKPINHAKSPSGMQITNDITIVASICQKVTGAKRIKSPHAIRNGVVRRNKPRGFSNI